MKRDLTLFLDDVLENIKDIQNFSENLTLEKFRKDKLRQKAISRSLEIIGEAVKNIPEPFRNKYPALPWKKIAGFRDVIVHSYFGIKIETIWNIIKENLPILEKEILDILEKEKWEEKNK